MSAMWAVLPPRFGRNSRPPADRGAARPKRIEMLMAVGTERGAVQGFSPYDVGRTGAIACQADQRFSYCLYVPPILVERGQLSTARILVAIHGTGRGNHVVRDLFVPLADRLGLIVLAPLFPAGIVDPDDRDNYKYVEFEGIRFDILLLSMVEEVGRKYGAEIDQFAIFGFSGGAHLAHRMIYLHPGRLAAVSACAPGSPTLLDTSRDWWIGIADIEERFGTPIDIEAMRQIAIHLAVGEDDLDASEIVHAPGRRHWMPGANDSGATRVERLRTLSENLVANGLDVKTETLPGVAHDCIPLAASASDFFDEKLAAAFQESGNA